MFGLYGPGANRSSVSLLRETGACGVLLLARNIVSPAQTRRLTEELVQKLGRPLLFSVDHEGGWVLRFQAGLTAFPGNAALGRAGDRRLAYATGRQMALELGHIGIGLNLAPVLDVATSSYNPGIGIRSFGAQPALVGRLGTALLRGLQDHGVAACAKHFPGKGAAMVDAHTERPTIRIPRRRFENTHLAPFAAAVKAGVASVMTSHVLFPALDTVPATFSRRITMDLLRGRLGFKGAIISDDLCMGAVTNNDPVPLAAQKAFAAGHDILLVAHEPTAQRESVDALRQFCAGDRRAARQTELSGARIGLLMGKARTRRRRPDPREGERVAARTAEGAVEVVRRGSVALPLPKPPIILFPDFREVSQRFTFENGPGGPERFAAEACRSHWGTAPKIMRAPVVSGSLAAVKRALAEGGEIVFFCFEAMRFPGQAAALKLLMKQAPERVVACLIRSSWDLAKLDRRTTALDLHGYRNCQLARAFALLGGKT
jgi:beta-N-acetylhexosaminidase